MPFCPLFEDREGYRVDSVFSFCSIYSLRIERKNRKVPELAQNTCQMSSVAILGESNIMVVVHDEKRWTTEVSECKFKLRLMRLSTRDT
jgi:hypothetical protein